MNDRELEDLIAIREMSDVGPWTKGWCPCCAATVTMTKLRKAMKEEPWK